MVELGVNLAAGRVRRVQGGWGSQPQLQLHPAEQGKGARAQGVSTQLSPPVLHSFCVC